MQALFRSAGTRRGLNSWCVRASSCLLVAMLVSVCTYRDSSAGGRDKHAPPCSPRTEKFGCAYPLLRLRGGKAGRRTQPSKVPKQFWTKRYQADWDKLKLRDNVVHDEERGLSGKEHVKMPGSYWAFGHREIDRAPNMTVGKDIPYEDAHLKSDHLLFHPGGHVSCLSKARYV